MGKIQENQKARTPGKSTTSNGLLLNFGVGITDFHLLFELFGLFFLFLQVPNFFFKFAVRLLKQ